MRRALEVSALAAVLAFAAVAAGCTRAPTCYQAAPGATGWVRVVLPDDAPHLAAPDGIEQFRTGEPAITWSADEPGWYFLDDLGRREFRQHEFGQHFVSSPQLVELEFRGRLGGARVDAEGDGPGFTYHLFEGRRIDGNRVRLEPAPRTTALHVTVHHHARAKPQLFAWRGGEQVRAGEVPGWPAALRQPRSLYFRGTGAPVELCEAPERPMALQRAWLEDTTLSAVTLSPTLRTRLLPRWLRRG